MFASSLKLCYTKTVHDETSVSQRAWVPDYRHKLANPAETKALSHEGTLALV